MKTTILALLLIAPSSFAAKGNSDVGSSTSSLKCRALSESVEDKVQVEIQTEAFAVSDYSGGAQVVVKGMSNSFMNISTKQSVYIKLENNGSNPAFIVPLQNKGDGNVILYFNDSKGQSARLVYRNVDADETILGEVTCSAR